MIAVRTFFMGKPLEENASSEKGEQEFATVDIMKMFWRIVAGHCITRNHFSLS